MVRKILIKRDIGNMGHCILKAHKAKQKPLIHHCLIVLFITRTKMLLCVSSYLLMYNAILIFLTLILL